MKYNGPCADTAGSAGEGLRKKGGTPMRKRNKVVSLLLAGCMAAGLLAGCGSSVFLNGYLHPYLSLF